MESYFKNLSKTFCPVAPTTIVLKIALFKLLKQETYIFSNILYTVY